MRIPFPGMDPYLEHPVLWPGVHTRLMVRIADLLRPLIRPRYVASIEERVYLAEPDDLRVPDVQVQKLPGNGQPPPTATTMMAEPVVIEVPAIEIREHYIEILDRYQDQHVVTVIEVVSPTNKAGGKGTEVYLDKQNEVRATQCHLVEIDLLRKGQHLVGVPVQRLEAVRPFDYLVCVNRWPERRKFEVYPRTLRQALPCVRLPLAAPDRDVPLDLQSAFEQVYESGDYMLRVRYDEPCIPSLKEADQLWASGCWQAYTGAHPELFPQAPS